MIGIPPYRDESVGDSKAFAPPVHAKLFPFDAFAGGMTYIADDFDETPDCFKETLIK